MCVSPLASKVAKGSLNPHSCHGASDICDAGRSQSRYMGPLPARGWAAILPGAPFWSRGEFCGHHTGEARISAPWENNPPPWEAVEHSRTGSSYLQPHGTARSFQAHTLPGLASSQVSLSCTFPQLFPPSLISGSFLSLFSHLSFYFVFRENARRHVLTWPTGTELRMESSPRPGSPALGLQPRLAPVGRRVPTLTGGPKASARRQRKTGQAPGAQGQGPKAENTTLSWHCQEATAVGLEIPNREKRAVATRKVEEGPQGPQPKWDRSWGASTPRHCLSRFKFEQVHPGRMVLLWPIFQVLDPEGTLGAEAQLRN